MHGKQPLKTLAALFERDHDRLLDLLDDSAALCRKGSYSSSAKVFGEFRQIIEHHMTAEERALDALAREGHCPQELAADVVKAHQLLHALIEDTWQAMQHDGAPFENALDGLKRGIAAHERTEQEELLPALCACYLDGSQLERAVYGLL